MKGEDNDIKHTRRLVKERGNRSGKLLDWFSAILDNRALITSIQSAPHRKRDWGCYRTSLPPFISGTNIHFLF